MVMFIGGFIFWIFTLSVLVLRSRSSGVARQPVTFFLQQKKVTKKCRNLTKIDPDMTYLLWGGFIQYILAVPT